MNSACKLVVNFKLIHALKQKSMELTFKIVFDKRHQKKNNTYSLKLLLSGKNQIDILFMMIAAFELS